MPRQLRTLVVTQSAKRDLQAISRYTVERWGQEQCAKYLTIVDQCFQRLLEAPLLGIDCGGIRSGYRRLPVGGHVIFYRLPDPDTVRIIRVLHASMDVKNHL